VWSSGRAKPNGAAPANGTVLVDQQLLVANPQRWDVAKPNLYSAVATLRNAGGGARIHRVDYDNAPAGRETHWASPLRWWMAALALVKHAVSGQPLGSAVEWAALYANPLLLGLLLVTLIPLVARRFGLAAAVVLALGVSAAVPFNLYFAADYPDHHGILEACGMLTVLFLVAGGGGLIRAGDTAGAGITAEERAAVAWLPAPGAARFWFSASAAAAGLSATGNAESRPGLSSDSWLSLMRNRFARAAAGSFQGLGRTSVITSAVKSTRGMTLE